MDVDLLRPGTVPISPETVLWFEFLLDSNLLLQHLEKPKPEPSATDLICKFITSVLDSVKNDIKRAEEEPGSVENILELKPKDSLKNLALKILCLKIAAHMHWNLDLLESRIPIKYQIYLLQDLMYFTNERKKIDIPNIPEADLVTISDPNLFSLVLYHRWLIRMVVNRSVNSKIPRQNPQNNEFLIGTIDDCFFCTPELIALSVNFLNSVLLLNRTPKLLTFDTFVMLNEDSTDVEQNWINSAELSRHEFEAQIHFDLGCFYFHKEIYYVAKQHFLKCDDGLRNLEADHVFVYANFDQNYLHGFLFACNISVEGYTPNLLQQLNASIADQYTGILSILQEDNKLREIPTTYRTVLELDIQGALSSGKFTVARDLLLQVQMLNVVRFVLDGETSHTGDFLHRLKIGGTKAIDKLFWAVNSINLQTCPEADKIAIKNFFMNLLMSENVPKVLDQIKTDKDISKLFDEMDYNIISMTQITVDNMFIPEWLKSTDWLYPDFSARRNPPLEEKILEQKLLSSYNISEISDLITKSWLRSANPVWKLSSNWELAIPLQSVVLSMTKGFFQDYCYILLAKSRELLNVKDFKLSYKILDALERDIKDQSSIPFYITFKLNKLVHWEALLVQIAQLFIEWPGNEVDKQSLIAKCKTCLSALKLSDAVIPRLEVIEQCALCLLNLGEWEFLCDFEKRWSHFEMAAAVAYACKDLAKYKGNKKVSRDMWYLVLPIFGPGSTQSKRSSTGNTTVLNRDSPTITSKANLISFLSCLRNSTALDVVISMLARLYNVLKDESSLELNVEYIVLWPAVLSNANSYNTKSVCEVLTQLVIESLKYYPNNMSWLKLMGDINFGNYHYHSAMKYYIETLIIATDFFNQPPCKPHIDDHIFKRMIKCCTQLNCHTQAAILCQFLDDIDYALAFKCLGENKSNNCNDAFDAYYNCIWDTTILEYLVFLHNKRGEFNRKQQAGKAIGMFEINSNNNEEIQREAMNVRKSRFLRALARQYLAKDF